jgi:hypothetical protein
MAKLPIEGIAPALGQTEEAMSSIIKGFPALPTRGAASCYIRCGLQ